MLFSNFQGYCQWVKYHNRVLEKREIFQRLIYWAFLRMELALMVSVAYELSYR